MASLRGASGAYEDRNRRSAEKAVSLAAESRSEGVTLRPHAYHDRIRAPLRRILQDSTDDIAFKELRLHVQCLPRSEFRDVLQGRTGNTFQAFHEIADAFMRVRFQVTDELSIEDGYETNNAAEGVRKYDSQLRCVA
jgi:hypothetical protein